MKIMSFKLSLSVALMAGAISLTGCIDDEGTTETGNTGTQLPPPDFYIPPAPPSPPPPPPPDQGSNPDEEFQEGGIEVVGGITRTRLPSVQIKVDRSFFSNMRVGSDANCENGDFKPIEDLFDFTLQKNQVNYITVQLADAEGARSDCFKVSVVHDDMGPNILFKKYPAPVLEEGTAPEIEYEITDASAVSAAQCGLNGQMKACPFIGSTVVSITQLPEGDYLFSVAARDELGNQSLSSVGWKVAASTRHLIQKFSLDDYRKVDVLIVIDNSGSMEYEQRNMAERVSSFISILRGLDWQIGVTTTDPRNIALGDGRLVPIHGKKNDYIFDSSMNEQTAQNLLGLTLQRPETGSGSEQGIKATYRVIERSLADANSPQRQLFREGAQFATLLISDEDESANGDKNDPHNLVKLVGDAFNGQKSFSFHSIITRPGDTACRKSDGYAYGDRYKAMSELTGGVLGSVCEMDYGAQLSAIAESVRDLLKTLTLQCEPIKDLPIMVSHQGQPYAGSFQVEGVNLRFSTELPPGEFTVDYHCLK